jgi:hypothetical protein
MSDLSKVQDAILRSLLGNRSYGKGNLAIGATPSAITSTAAVPYSIGGVMYSRAAFTNQALVSGGEPFRVQPPNTTVYYSVGVDAAGNVNVVQGRFEGERFISPTGMSVVGDGTVPPLPATHAPIGLLKVVTGAASFTPGTTNLNAAGVTTTIWDVSALPVNDKP